MENEANGIARENFLSHPDSNAQAPQSRMTIAEFVADVFVPEYVALKTPAGRVHYQAILKHVLRPEDVDRAFRVDPEKSKPKLETVPGWPYLGEMRLRDVRPDDVQKLISAALARGYSAQTVKHMRNVVSAIFACARKKRWVSDENPASQVTLPGMIRKQAHTLTLAQVRDLLSVMQHPEKEVALIAIFTGMNIAEICGLQWKYVNLDETWSEADGEAIPPGSIAVRQQWYLGRLGGVNGKSRNRNLPIPDLLYPVLRGLSRRREFTGPNDFVLVSRAGTPVSGNNLAARRLRPIGISRQMPWLSWQVFRRTHRTLPHQVGLQLLDRAAMTDELNPDASIYMPVDNLSQSQVVAAPSL